MERIVESLLARHAAGAQVAEKVRP
jgi:hypothetical protein